MCQEKMAKKALTVQKHAHISSSWRAAKSLFLLIGLLLFFHFSMTESSYQTWYVIFLHNGSQRGRSEVATAAIMRHFCCDVMNQSKWPARHRNVLAISMSESNWIEIDRQKHLSRSNRNRNKSNESKRKSKCIEMIIEMAGAPSKQIEIAKKCTFERHARSTCEKVVLESAPARLPHLPDHKIVSK